MHETIRIPVRVERRHELLELSAMLARTRNKRRITLAQLVDEAIGLLLARYEQVAHQGPQGMVRAAPAPDRPDNPSESVSGQRPDGASR